MSQKLTMALAVFYLIILIAVCWERKWAQALYWLGAFILILGVRAMAK